MSLSGNSHLNKSDLIKILARQKNITIKQADEVVNFLFDVLTDTLATGERVNIRGLGSFFIKDYESYAGRNPKTGEPVMVAAKKLPYFRVGREVRENILS